MAVPTVGKPGIPGKLEAIKQAVAAKPRTKIAINRFGSELQIPTSILLYGKSRSGKSKAIADLLQCTASGELATGPEDGMKIVCLNTDLGGEAATIETIRNILTKEDKLELFYKNFVSIPSEDYETTSAFISDPVTYFPELWDFNPDFFAWDGFSSYQLNQVDEYVLTQEDRAEVKDETGLRSGRQDWGSIYRATRRALQKFINIKNPNGKALHKFMTCLEATSGGDYGTTSAGPAKAERGPLLDGKAKTVIAASFSLVLIAQQVNEGGKVVYKYQTRGDDKMIAGTRGHVLENFEDADMRKIWAKIR